MDTISKAVDEHLKKLDLEMADLGTTFKVVTSRLENMLEVMDQILQVRGHRLENIENPLLGMNKIYEKVVFMKVQISSELKIDQKKGVEGPVDNLRFGIVILTPGLVVKIVFLTTEVNFKRI